MESGRPQGPAGGCPSLSLEPGLYSKASRVFDELGRFHPHRGAFHTQRPRSRRAVCHSRVAGSRPCMHQRTPGHAPQTAARDGGPPPQLAEITRLRRLAKKQRAALKATLDRWERLHGEIGERSAVMASRPLAR